MVCFIAKHQYPERLSKFNKMTIIVKYFGLVADITNKKEELFSLNESLLTTRDLLTYIHQKYTDLKDTSFVIAVNKTIATNDLKLNNKDIIALLPPFAGG